jgi:TnpA family transposase
MLARWVDDRAWTTGDGPGTLFAASVGWLHERKVLLPAASTIRRLVGHVSDAAMQRLLATIVHLQARATDDALEVFDVLMSNDLLAKAHRESKKETLRRYPAVSRDAGKLAAAVAVLLKVTDAGTPMTLQAIWQAIEAVVSRADLRAAVDNLRQVVPAPNEDPDAEWRGALVQRYGVVRRFLPEMVSTIQFEGTGEAGPLLEAFRALPALMEARPTVDVPAGHLDAKKVSLDLVPPAWRRIVLPPGRPEGTVHRAGYVFCLLEQFHQRLSRRDIFAPASSRWADPRSQLLTGDAWEAVKGPVLNALELPEDPAELLADHARTLDAALRDVAARLDAHVHASVDDQGRIHASALAAIPDPPSLVDLRKRTQAMLPRVDIGEVVLEVMSWEPGIVEAFTAVSGGESRLEDLHVSLAGVLTARALNVGYGPVISEGTEALTRDRLSHVDQNYVRTETIGPANAPLIEAQGRISLATDHWGGGLMTAADGIRFVVPVRSVQARPNPKYFGRRRGVTWLNLMNDRSLGTAGMIVSGTARDSLHVVDLIYRQEAGPRPEVVVSDAGAYSDIVFGLLNLLDIEYRPQPTDLPDAKLWHIDPAADYGPLATAARGRIDLARITAHWPDLVRIVGSIHTGAVSAHDVIRMLSRGANLTQLGEALASYGRIFKTLYVLSYLDEEPYRRQIKRLRNLQEGRHDLARHLFHGRRGELHEAYREGMEDQVGALGLVINCVVLWNTVYLDAAVAKLRAEGYPVRDDDLARLSAYVREHINVAGHYFFELPELPGARRALRDPDSQGDPEG